MASQGSLMRLDPILFGPSGEAAVASAFVPSPGDDAFAKIDAVRAWRASPLSFAYRAEWRRLAAVGWPVPAVRLAMREWLAREGVP